MEFHAIKSVSNLMSDNTYQPGDVLVLFGELFPKGYANGLVAAAEKKGMKVIFSTVGRREKDHTLRKLNADEIPSSWKNFINIPLEAGFDLESGDNGISVVEMLKDIKLSDWQNAQLDWKQIEIAKAKGDQRFRKATQEYLNELRQHLVGAKRVLFAHLMAGGIPRAKILMPLINRVVKGRGDRFLDSRQLWDSELGKLCALSFSTVTAQTFKVLLDETKFLHKELPGTQFSYLGYGYRGTEILIGNEFKWQTYTPYLQGWAKIELEGYAAEAMKNGTQACIFNCPEILTNSSAVFSGLEVSLFPLLNAMKQSKISTAQFESQLKENSLSEIKNITDKYFQHPVTLAHCNLNNWPGHSHKDQLENMIQTSETLSSLHIDEKNNICFGLSDIVVEHCGIIMLLQSAKTTHSSLWIGHDVLCQSILQQNS